MRVIVLFRRVRQQYRLDRVVSNAGGVKIFDLRVHAVAVANAVEPGSGIERVGVGAALPQIDAAGPAVLGIDELLADEARDVAEAGRDVAEMRGAGVEIDARRQLVLHDRGDHRCPLSNATFVTAWSRSSGRTRSTPGSTPSSRVRRSQPSGAG